MKLPLRPRAWLAAALALAMPAMAHAGTCGLTTVSGGTASQTYDPFNPATSTIQLSNLVLSRVNGAGGEKTASLNFYIKGQSASQDGTSVVFNSATGSGTGTGYGQNLFFSFSSPGPTPLDNSSTPVAGIFRWNFNGNNAASDTFTVNATITLPANLNLSASSQLAFDIVYSCAGTGGGGPFTSTGTVPSAITANIVVPSALRATYAGTALDFGEIGQVATANAATAKTSATNYIRVQSTGPYSVSMTSNGNYLLTPGGTATSDPNQKVGWSLKFLGQTRSPTNTSAIALTCARANVSDAIEDHLALQGTLVEGGAGKAPSANYRDTLTVTITPLAASTSSFPDCGNFTVP